MRTEPILDAISDLLAGDSAVSAIVALHRKYVLERGVKSSPICLIGANIELQHIGECIGDEAGARPQIWGIKTSILVLSRIDILETGISFNPPKYPPGKTGIVTRETSRTRVVDTELTKLDSAQSAIAAVISANPRLSGTVEQSHITSVKRVTGYNQEYFGFEIQLEATSLDG